MHRVWDSGIIERADDNEDFWFATLIAELDGQKNPMDAQRGTTEDWATESLLAARAAYVMPDTGALIKPGRKLGDEYQAANLPVVKKRLYQGGARLAMVLNEAFPEE